MEPRSVVYINMSDIIFYLLKARQSTKSKLIVCFSYFIIRVLESPSALIETKSRLVPLRGSSSESVPGDDM
jgi:alpha-N-acetylglucosamine transferase